MAEDNCRPSYLEYVNALAEKFPRLRLLADFMSPDIRISDYHSDHEVERRMKKVDVMVLDIGSAPTPLGHFNDLDSLVGHLDINPPSGSLRIILAEDLSRDVIELLGSRFSLDPRFFENHLQGVQSFLTDKWTGDRTPRMESTASDILSREFHMVQFTRPYQFISWDSLSTSRLKLNMPRLGNRVINFHLRENASLYGPVRYDEDSFAFIVICDPLLDESLPDRIYLRDQNPLPRYSELSRGLLIDKLRMQDSFRSVLKSALFKTKNQYMSDIKDLILQTILAKALDFHAVALFELNLSLQHFNSRHSYRTKDSYQSMLRTINVSGGWTNTHNFIRLSLFNMRNYEINLLSLGKDRQSIELELQAVEAQYAEAQCRTNQLLEFLRQEQDIVFTQNFERLTKMAFLFVPSSTIAAILSIDGSQRLAVFFGLAVPISILCVLIGFYGVSTTDILSPIYGFTRAVSTRYREKMALRIGIKRDADRATNLDVEVPRAHQNDLDGDLIEKISTLKAAYAEESMSYFVGDAQNSSTKRRRVPRREITSNP